MNRPLRVLVPNYAGTDTFTDNVVHTLRAMGHEARSMPFRAFRDRGRVQRVLTDAWTGFRPQTLSAQERWALAAARDWKPDLVLTLTVQLRDEVLEGLKRAGVGACVVWWGDPPANMRGMGLLSDGWDRIYIKDADAAARLAALGLPADLLHEAANPDWHRPLPSPDHPDTGRVVVAGSFYGYRQFLVGRLIQAGVPLALHGPQPPRWSDPRVLALFSGRYIVRDDKSRAFHAGLACLNSTTMQEGNSLNCRAFEICATGGLQLIEARRIVAQCYEPGSEVLTYASVPEILDHLDRARREPDWARAVREAGLRRTLAHHTYRHRLDRILGDLGMAPNLAS